MAPSSFPFFLLFLFLSSTAELDNTLPMDSCLEALREGEDGRSFPSPPFFFLLPQRGAAEQQGTSVGHIQRKKFLPFSPPFFPFLSFSSACLPRPGFSVMVGDSFLPPFPFLSVASAGMHEGVETS